MFKIKVHYIFKFQLQSPFFGEKQNLLAIVRKISKCATAASPTTPASDLSKRQRCGFAAASGTAKHPTLSAVVVFFTSLSPSSIHFYSLPSIYTFMFIFKKMLESTV
jgi:hypothetical protein